MPPMRMRGDGRKAKDPKKTFLRLLGYLKPYLPRLIVMVVCIGLATAASVTSNASLQRIVDDYITPMLGQTNPDFGPLIGFLCMMAGVYLVGIVANFLVNFVMVPVGQGIQKNIRDTLFTHMQKLPIRYFDTNQVGNLMSRFTSDIDTLRQMITQAIPQCIVSVVTIVVVFFAMLATSWILTLVVLVSVVGIFFITAKVAGHSAKFFIGQQQSLGAVNGYVEEMVTGQRVVKVFTHEEVCKEEFDKLNDTLRKNAFKAGVSDVVRTFQCDCRKISAPGRRGTIVTNPPYGERLGSAREVEKLYKEIGEHFRSLSPWQVYVITSHEGFERLYGKRADKVRKLYNGMIPCYLYQFFKNK